jgi:lipopolysaccharide transport system permease protein
MEHGTRDEFSFEPRADVSVRHGIVQLWEFRECLWAFAARSLRVRYKQAVLGLGWAILQPLAFLALFVIVFGNIADMSGGGVPYAAFALSALVPWQFLSNGVAQGADALIQDAGLLRKIYFPREVPVLGAIASYLPDFGIGIVLFLLAAPITGANLDWELVYLPLLFLAITLPIVAVTVPVAALALYYRDFKYALPVLIQLWLFASPVAYPLTEVPASVRWIYAIVNPVVGPLDAFRNVLAVGTSPDWLYLGLSTLSALVLLVGGFHVFKRLEPEFADVV